MRGYSICRLTVLAALLWLAACAAPPPPPQGPPTFSASGTAIVTGGPGVDAYLFGRSQVTITRIDDTVLVDGDNNPLYRTIEVAGGAHAVYFSYRHSALCVTGSACAMSLLRERKLALDAKAGHLYRVGATYRRGRFWAWITDESDEGAVVSGNLPGGADWAADVRGFGGGQVF
ncbi:MAG: hypothetical protein IID28_11345 [Planctomycetes bacterium]|nr:hypothetical protein [Planctomycetota bacterium]